MDPTTGDPARAVKEVDEGTEQKIEERLEKNATNEKVAEVIAERKVGDIGVPTIEDTAEKRSPESRSSDSSQSASLRDEKALEKLDSRIVPIGKVKEGDEAYAHLPEHEREIIKRQLDVPTVSVSFKTIYRYATTNDLIIVAVAAICAIIGGAALPLMTILFGNLAGTFQGYFNGTIDSATFNSDLGGYVLYFVYLAIGEFITIYLATLGFIYTGEHVTQKIREQYLAAILRQNMGFFDKLGAGEITTRITADTNLIQDGISEKVSLTLSAIATFVTAFIVG